MPPPRTPRRAPLRKCAGLLIHSLVRRAADAVVIDGQHLSDQAIFANTGAIIYVLDAQDDPTGAPVERLHDIVTRASRVNPSIYFAVFVHKVDGDMFLSEDLKAECQREVQQRVMQELASASTDVQIGFFLTRCARQRLWPRKGRPSPPPSPRAVCTTTPYSRRSARWCRRWCPRCRRWRT